ncbi:hypothetical protein L2E82_20284 [Cichorium intybus]|uniref:Uncharacterized protein n=1 Tax=Cichorium intybus TaxID=13427 RepID=A0ACB9DT64_CICIN|nr:hypothetical protein L2E82_20284 [Cichorium intybus]
MSSSSRHCRNNAPNVEEFGDIKCDCKMDRKEMMLSGDKNPARRFWNCKSGWHFRKGSVCDVGRLKPMKSDFTCNTDFIPTSLRPDCRVVYEFPSKSVQIRVARLQFHPISFGIEV